MNNFVSIGKHTVNLNAVNYWRLDGEGDSARLVLFSPLAVLEMRGSAAVTLNERLNEHASPHRIELPDGAELKRPDPPKPAIE